MFNRKVINNIKVKKIQLPKTNHDVKGKEYLRNPYTNVFICAHKESGKTVTLWNMLKNTIDKDTEVIFFVSTLYNDPTYSEIIKKLDKRDIKHTDFTSLCEDGIDYLGNFINFLKDEAKRKQEEEIADNDEEAKENEKEKKLILREKRKIYGSNVVNVDDDEISVKLKKNKKYLVPEYVFVFDDISAEIKTHPKLPYLLKMNRHFKCKIFLSTQYVTDVPPSGRSQFNVYILFGGHNNEKLKDIYEASDPRIDFHLFKSLYEDATSERFNFFYVDKDNGTYRKNFNEQYILYKGPVQFFSKTNI